VNDFGVLIDVGVGPRLLASRLTALGRSLNNVHAVVLTHTHADHWNERTLAFLRERGIALYCHPDHCTTLVAASSTFAKLRHARLVHEYEPSRAIKLSPRMTCTPFSVRHDDTTCGFRFDATAGDTDSRKSVGYAADLGCWDQEIVSALADVDVLALEFNHDVALERASGRSNELILRVLGNDGHLSNDQAAELLREVLLRSPNARLRHLVQLHLSRQCNRVELAIAAARAVVAELQAEMTIHTAMQFRAGPCLIVSHRSSGSVPLRIVESPYVQAMLPGWE